METLIINKSIHHNSTLKIAQCMTDVMDAKLIEPKEFDSINLQDYDLIGFGSGIYDGTLHTDILKIADNLPNLNRTKVFIFSTGGVVYEKSHIGMRGRLIAKNADIVGDFYCKGFNTNSFLKYFSGMNKGRPNVDDLDNAQIFAEKLILQTK